jgi:hypothetical protein
MNPMFAQHEAEDVLMSAFTDIVLDLTLAEIFQLREPSDLVHLANARGDIAVDLRHRISFVVPCSQRSSGLKENRIEEFAQQIGGNPMYQNPHSVE